MVVTMNTFLKGMSNDQKRQLRNISNSDNSIRTV